ncbi:MAG: hypothetical protein ACXADU_04895 [Promethearchaeota archaeon]|jgi:hypothetical protein
MSKKNFFIGFSMLLVMILSITNINVRANPPSNMSLSYIADTDQLDVTITHLTGGTAGHFIENVTIRVNGSIVHSETYTSQPSPTTFTYQYTSIVANIGATINVWANCSLTGDIITRQLTVTGGNGTTTPNGAIPGYLGIWMISIAVIGIIGLLIYKKIRKVN